MGQDSVVIPAAVRIPRKLWNSLEEIMRKRKFSGKGELVRDALREHVLLHQKAATPRFRISEAAVTLRDGRTEDRKREKELIEWVRRIRT